MPDSEPAIVICTFRVKQGSEEQLLKLCREHDATLRQLALAVDEPAQIYHGADERGLPFVVQIFSWASADAVRAAHNHPEVMKLWEAMEPLCEERDGRPSMEFPHVTKLEL